MDRGPLSDDEQRALEAWAGADPRRAGAYAKARAVSLHFDRARALGEDFRPDLHPAATWRTRRRLVLGGVGLAASAVFGLFGYAAYEHRHRIATPKGDVRRVALADGSAVTLNTDSAVRPRLEAEIRQVELVHGEALFDVAKDSTRPFVVFAREVRVRAVGTSFVVRALPDRPVEVLVREGVVEVSRGEGPPVRLQADQTVTVEPARALQPRRLATGQAERATAWRQGLLDLNGLTLAQAAHEYERYTDRRIYLADPEMGQMKVTGLFSINNPDGFARAAALSLNLVATPAADGMRLTRTPD